LSYRGNRPTNKQTQTQPQTGPFTIHYAAASAQFKNVMYATNIIKVPPGDIEEESYK